MKKGAAATVPPAFPPRCRPEQTGFFPPRSGRADPGQRPDARSAAGRASPPLRRRPRSPSGAPLPGGACCVPVKTRMRGGMLGCWPAWKKSGLGQWGVEGSAAEAAKGRRMQWRSGRGRVEAAAGSRGEGRRSAGRQREAGLAGPQQAADLRSLRRVGPGPGDDIREAGGRRRSR